MLDEDGIDCSEAEARGFTFLISPFFRELEMVCGADFALAIRLAGFLEVERTMVGAAKVKG